MSKIEKVAFETLFPVMEEALSRGDTVVFAPSGTSMQPLLTAGRDRVVLSAVNDPLRRGDVVLYRRESGQFVLHRIVGRAAEGFRLRGDNQRVTEYPVKREQIVARMSGFYRKNKLYKAHGAVDRWFFAIALPLHLSKLLWRRITRN